MAEPIKYESQIPAIAKLLLGEQQKTGGTTTTTGSANTLPLEQVFAQALSGGAAGVPEMQALIKSIFTEGSSKIPAITQAYANATGSRTTGNSGLALALEGLNREMSTAAAQAILTNQTNNRQIATNAGSSIAQATRSETKTSNQTQTTGTKTNPLLATLAGWGLNKADKSGLFKKLGSKVGGIFGDGEVNDVASLPAYGSDLDLTQGGAMAGDPLGSGIYDVGASAGFDAGFSDAGGFDATSLVDSGLVFFDDIGGGDSFDLGGTAGFWDDIGGGVDAGLDFGGGFAADGFWDDIGGADIGWDTDYSSFFDFDFADGGAVSQRNRNYMGTGAPRQLVSALNPGRAPAGSRPGAPTGQVRRRPERTDMQVQDPSTGGEGVTDASNTGGVVGTPSQNSAAIAGMVSLGLAPALGVPSAITSMAMNAMGVPTMSMSPMSQALSAISQALGITGGGSSSNAGPDGDGTGSDGPGGVGGGIGSASGGAGTAAGDTSGNTEGSGGPAAGSGAGTSGDGSVGDAASAGVDGGDFADGGAIRGPGTGTSDSIKANVSDGEYIFPADVVRYFGTRTLDRMKGMLHKPAHMSGGKSRMG